MLLCVELGRAGTGDGDGGRNLTLTGRAGGTGGVAITAVGLPGLYLVFQEKTKQNATKKKIMYVDIKQEEGRCRHVAPGDPQLLSALLAEEIRDTILPSSC